MKSLTKVFGKSFTRPKFLRLPTVDKALYPTQESTSDARRRTPYIMGIEQTILFALAASKGVVYL